MANKGFYDLEDLDCQLKQVAYRLGQSFQGVFSNETIERYIHESYDLLSGGAEVTLYLAALTERFAKERLRALAQSQDLIAKEQPEILFVCVHNAGRSQMAAALATQISGGKVSVRSAGSAPSESIPDSVKLAMSEIDIDLSDAFPKPLTDEVVRAADVVITMGCGDACPIYPGKVYLDWDLADPSELDMEGVRAVRNEIESRIRNLLVEIKVTI